ncbi:MAG: hypothetical protein AUJ92_01465 [Armatimonadetes bacterium CG2_30_59_28]|nr:hypothetical protein [Armatimonadota bacterium]OIO98353.1 MAG: hypothetical protein AUJ92_01465 [Armatimonadetes bacterium CG2_30_59_28]PIU63884.1 MAG: hypothetical protein COS85_14745 [Armatimonadetes bacterium CG07_land_8_20_14_0_80_59_28]PIX38679.1 MAG: hypothetical protein COZ56_19765 [Armatimonadetes bacterium CG_4_8_14_3_um_filter_58_9]PIY43858.1 MAG: hypothetical protein COZ05_09875 [Armatimonadetes bacterium CG_4_10_14_3_um_filter_59_10]PJB74840.1 MAG: hypothetical protein CO095_043
MSLDQINQRLRLGCLPEDWTQRWPASEPAFISGGVFFLQPTYLRHACDTIRMDAEITGLLLDAAQRIAAEPTLERLASHCHYLLFESGLELNVRQWPQISREIHAAGPLFYAVVYLSGLPSIQRLYRQRGIAESVMIHTLSDLELWIREHKRRNGAWGFSNLGWMHNHFREKLIALGRLQFIPGKFGSPFHFYRDVRSGKVVGLAEGGCLFRDDGQFANADYGTIRKGYWASRLEMGDRQITGNPISPWGVVERREITLARDAWPEILRSGDPTMTVHIPASGPMTPKACGDSFREAVSFLPRHFPDWPFRAFTCISWLLDPQLEAMDPRPANLAAFPPEWYLHPVDGATERQALERVFDIFEEGTFNLAAAPMRTSLQRGIIAFMRRGGHLRSTGGVLFPEDLDWGKSVYRKSWKGVIGCFAVSGLRQQCSLSRSQSHRRP